MTKVAIALGGNLGDPIAQFQQALQGLSEHPQIDSVQCSSWYRSSPMGPADQPDYINAVATAETSLDAHTLLDLLQHLEHQAGRIRGRRWGERTLDLDLILFGHDTISTERLSVPHPGLLERDFVLLPLLEIWPTARLPNGEQLSAYQSKLTHHDLVRIN